MRKKNFLTTRERLSKTSGYKTDPQIQSLLFRMNRALQPVEFQAVSRLRDFSNIPVLFISYLPRSGSTFLSQLLISTGRFNYISNFQSKWWLAPYAGGILERMLLDKPVGNIAFNSDYGLTRHWYEPSEFSYFWEYWLNLSENKSHTLSKRDAAKVNWELLAKEINAIRSLSRYPLIFKKEWLGMNAGLLIEKIPNSRFIYLDRNPYDLMVSILRARQEVFGNLKSWWAAKPSNYLQLLKLAPELQVAGQIAGIRKDIKKWVELYPEKFLCMDYETLVGDVHAQVRRIGDFAGIKIEGTGMKNLPAIILRRKSKRPGSLNRRKIIEAIKEFKLNG